MENKYIEKNEDEYIEELLIETKGENIDDIFNI